MPSDRFFIPEPFHPGQTLSLTGDEHHHMLHVMRSGVGASVEIINGGGDLALATLTHVGKKEALLRIESLTHTQKLNYSLRLAIGLPRFNRLEYILEKATELGISDFILFPAEGSEKKEISDNQWQRIFHLLSSSIKQCGRLYLPVVSFLPSLDNWMLHHEKSFFGDTRSEKSRFIQKIEPGVSTTVFIGPEKGFSHKEITFLENNLQAEGVSLSSHTLRVDTAAIAAAAQLSSIN